MLNIILIIIICCCCYGPQSIKKAGQTINQMHFCLARKAAYSRKEESLENWRFKKLCVGVWRMVSRIWNVCSFHPLNYIQTTVPWKGKNHSKWRKSLRVCYTLLRKWFWQVCLPSSQVCEKAAPQPGMLSLHPLPAHVPLNLQSLFDQPGFLTADSRHWFWLTSSKKGVVKKWGGSQNLRADWGTGFWSQAATRGSQVVELQPSYTSEPAG